MYLVSLGMDVCGLYHIATDSSVIRDLNNWTNFEERLKSYTNWPIQMNQTNRDMAHAGFFYLNRGDSVQCFKCDMQLKGWEDMDTPWAEHEKWSPDCPYIQMVGVHIEEKGKRRGDNRIDLVDVAVQTIPKAQRREYVPKEPVKTKCSRRFAL